MDHPLDPGMKPTTLVDVLRWRADREPDTRGYTFLADGETDELHLTYGELDRRARTIAAVLRDSEAEHRPVLLVFPSGLEYVEAFFGCLHAGSIAVAASPPRPNRPLGRFETIVRDSGAPIILTLEAIRSRMERVVASVGGLERPRWIATDRIDERCPAPSTEPDIDGEALALIQYTSGSIGTPRGTMVSHRNLLHNSAIICEAFRHTKETVVVGWLPTTHDMGLVGNMLQPLYVGCPYVFMSPEAFLMKPVRWLQAISRHRGTTSGGPNFAYDICSAKVRPEQKLALDLSCWDLAFNGAERVRHDTLSRFSAAFYSCGFRPEAFYPCYGLAEATLMVTGGSKGAARVERTLNGDGLRAKRAVMEQDPDRGPVLVGCGRAWAGQQVLIVDPETSRRCESGRIGEIWIGGPSVAQGYWNRRDETREVFHAYLGETGEGPYLRTGDLGFVEDEHLFITGRVKDLIIVAGANHFPADIEATVEESHPSIRSSCVAAFAVQSPDIERLVIVAEIDRRLARRHIDEVTDAIREAVSVNHELSAHAICLIKQATIPKTSSGKIQRHVCRERYLAGTLDLVNR